jgi:serine/threonine protein kinase
VDIFFYRGRYSVVKKCVDKISGKEYAAKFIKKRMCSQQDVEREVTVLRRLKHPNINIFVDSFENDKNWILVLELLPNGRLFDSIVVANPWTEKEAVGFVKQILEAVQHLHDCRVAHLDLKVRWNFSLVVFNFSFCKLTLSVFGNGQFPL